MRMNQIIAGLIFFCAGLSAQALPILNIQNGILMGASGVIVEGHKYDVRFRQGLSGEYLGAINNLSSGIAAATALSNDVFVGEYDVQPWLVNGCSYVDCSVSTIYGFHSFFTAYPAAASFTNSVNENFDQIYTDNVIFPMDIPYTTFAIWTRTAVPEPTSITLFAFSGVLLFFSRRRYKCS